MIHFLSLSLETTQLEIGVHFCKACGSASCTRIQPRCQNPFGRVNTGARSYILKLVVKAALPSRKCKCSLRVQLSEASASACSRFSTNCLGFGGVCGERQLVCCKRCQRTVWITAAAARRVMSGVCQPDRNCKTQSILDDHLAELLAQATQKRFAPCHSTQGVSWPLLQRS